MPLSEGFVYRVLVVGAEAWGRLAFHAAAANECFSAFGAADE